MKLLIVLALVAFVSATPETVCVEEPVELSVELPAPAAPTITEEKTDTSKNGLSTADAKPDAVKVVNPTITETIPEVSKTPIHVVLANDLTSAQTSNEQATVKVVDAPLESLQIVVPTPVQISETNSLHDQKFHPEDIHYNPISLIDISPLIVPEEVMKQIAQMNLQETDAVNVGGPNPFSFDNTEPLYSVERVNVIDGPKNQLDSKMDPVVVVESPTGEQASFAETIVPEPVKVVDISDTHDVVQAVPVAFWRNPPQFELPKETWRVPPQIPQDIAFMYRPRPAFYRGAPRDQYQMPAQAFNDPFLR